jgi:hypothetical protein
LFVLMIVLWFITKLIKHTNMMVYGMPPFFGCPEDLGSQGHNHQLWQGLGAILRAGAPKKMLQCVVYGSWSKGPWKDHPL